jgi:hypothetical protein
MHLNLMSTKEVGEIPSGLTTVPTYLYTENAIFYDTLEPPTYAALSTISTNIPSQGVVQAPMECWLNLATLH